MTLGFLSNGIEPSLIHCVEIEIQRLVPAETNYDPVFREAVDNAKVYSDPIVILAQIHWQSDEELIASQGGSDPKAAGWITMLARQFDDDEIPGGPFKTGDRIMKVDAEDYSDNPLYIVQPKKAGQYGTQHLRKFLFSSRQETTDALRDNLGSGGQ